MTYSMSMKGRVKKENLKKPSALCERLLEYA